MAVKLEKKAPIKHLFLGNLAGYGFYVANYDSCFASKLYIAHICSAYDNCRSSDNFRVKLLRDQSCADLFGENVHG